MRPVTGTCSSCRWWQPDRYIRDYGECRFGPPCSVDTEQHPSIEWGMLPRPVWPNTRSHDWCGRHERREAEAQP